MDTTSLIPLTRTGVERLIVVPSPSCPMMLAPHDQTVFWALALKGNRSRIKTGRRERASARQEVVLKVDITHFPSSCEAARSRIDCKRIRRAKRAVVEDVAIEPDG